MKLPFTSRLLICILATSFLFSCQKEISGNNESHFNSEVGVTQSNQAQKQNTYYGPQMPLGNGRVRTFVTISHTGVPSEIGIEMTAGAIEGPGEEMLNLSLPFHQKAGAATPFDHVLLDWNPHGHEPFFYELPHYDFHFYTISETERMAIAAGTPLMDQLPPMQYWPQGFVPTPGGVPQMGKHWINPASPEISGGQLFTHTMIYGSYAGGFIFVEPMITRDFLLRGQPVTMAYGQPAQFMRANTYYPATYNIYRRDGKYYITLGQFTWRS